jgi:hypothetical protein
VTGGSLLEELVEPAIKKMRPKTARAKKRAQVKSALSIASATEQDVPWLNVTVQNSVLMRVMDGARDPKRLVPSLGASTSARA